MSSSAGKFQDHYEVLGIDPKSSLEFIERAYTELSEKYHPDNLDTADAVKFEAVAQAREVLADPFLRREFDKIKGIGGDGDAPRFSGLTFFDALGREAGLRTALLCVLYDRRRTKPFTPTLSLRQIESIVDATVEELNFAIWYLKQRSFATIDDKSTLQITVEGMDLLEANHPSPATIMTFIKSSAVAPKGIAPKEPAPAQARMGARVMGLMK